VLAILANTLVFFIGNTLIQLPFITLTLYDIMVILIIILGIVLFTVNSTTMAIDLSREDRAALHKRKLEEHANRRAERMARQQQTRQQKIRARSTQKTSASRPLQIGRAVTKRRSV
jgi:hypothetical protein